MTQSKDKRHGEIVPLTGLRGLAAWWVVFYHFKEYLQPLVPGFVSAFLAKGYLAVDLFFVLSGFVLFLNYRNSFSSDRSGAVRTFLRKRIARVYPLHLLMCVLFLVNPLAIAYFAPGVPLGARYTPDSFVASLLMAHNWGFFDGLVWNVPSWSISTEWFAYLLFPGMVLLVNRYVQSIWRAVSVAIVIGVAIYMYFDSAGAASIDHLIAAHGLIRCVLQFSLGILSCVIFLELKKRFKCVWYASLGVFLVAVGMFLFLPIRDFSILPLAFVALVMACADEHFKFATVLSNRIVAYLGLISYSTYMVHYFIRDWTRFFLIDGSDFGNRLAMITYLLVTAVCSAVLYHWVEKPCRSLLRNSAGHETPSG